MSMEGWKYKREAMTAASELGYGEAVVLRIKASQSVEEIETIMRTTRKSMKW